MQSDKIIDKSMWKLDYKNSWYNGSNLLFNGIYRFMIGSWIICMLSGLLLYELGLWIFRLMEDIWGDKKNKNKKNKNKRMGDIYG